MSLGLEVAGVMRDIFTGPFLHPNLLWQIAPLFILWIGLEIYFGRYKKERLGWNTALANGISIFWVVLSNFQFVFFAKDRFDNIWLIILPLTLLAAYSLFLIYTAFTHYLKTKWAYILASPTTTYYFSIISILLAHQIITFNLPSVIGIFTFYFFLVFIFYFFKIFIPDVDVDLNSPPKEDFLSSSDLGLSNSKSSSSFHSKNPFLPGGLEKKVSTPSSLTNTFPPNPSLHTHLNTKNDVSKKSTTRRFFKIKKKIDKY